jgi:hypothetical protein
MQITAVFHENVSYEHFRPFRHQSAQLDIWGGHGSETFGEDLQLAFCYDENHVWTVMDGEAGPDQWITPGFHRINCICFLLTEIAHYEAPIEFRIERGPRSLTPLGLTRRITTLKKILAANEAGDQ